MAEVQLKIYKQNVPGNFGDPKLNVQYQIASGYNVPQGTQETTLEDFLANAADSNKQTALNDLNFVSKGNYTIANIGDAFKTGASPYTTDPKTGALTTKVALDTAEKLANDPNMLNIGTADAPLYVPKGSPAAANVVNFGTQNTANTMNAIQTPQNITGNFEGPQLVKLIQDSMKATGKNYAIVNGQKVWTDGSSIGGVPDYIPESYTGPLNNSVIDNFTNQRNTVASQLNAAGLKNVNNQDIDRVMSGIPIQTVISEKNTATSADPNSANNIKPGETPAQWQARIAANTGTTTQSTPGTTSNTASSNDALMAVYAKRPDLQALYNPDGSAKNPNDPKIRGIPTLSDWAVKYGKNEDPTLNNYQAPLPFDPASVGIDPQTWAQLSPADKAFAQSLAGVVKGQYDQGQVNVSINQDLLNKALQAAQSDPDILARYGDSAKLGAAALQFNLAQLNSSWNVQQTQQNLALEKQKKDLALAAAQAGQAYSGYREQAKQRLNAEQASVIQSSSSQLKNSLQQLGSSYESMFGSSGLPSVSAGGMAYSPTGGITGSEALSKKADILNKQQQIYNLEKPA
jgi:hypothetical protein